MNEPAKILVAEDDPVLQKIVEILLKRMNVPFTMVSNGAEAVAAACEDDFTLILMDLQMPELTGIEAADAIRKKEKETGRHTPIVAMSAFDDEICAGAGMDECLPKPIDFRAFQDLVDRYSGRH